MENIYSVIITAITVLGGTTAFRFYEKRAMRKERDDEFIRHDCKDRIAKSQSRIVKNAGWLSAAKIVRPLLPRSLA